MNSLSWVNIGKFVRIYVEVSLDNNEIPMNNLMRFGSNAGHERSLTNFYRGWWIHSVITIFLGDLWLCQCNEIWISREKNFEIQRR